jgi:hypothetical protein
MRTGEINANLLDLNSEFKLPFLSDLVARKQSGENTSLPDADIQLYQQEYDRLRTALECARDDSQLPEAPAASTKVQLHELLVRIRMSAFN